MWKNCFFGLNKANFGEKSRVKLVLEGLGGLESLEGWEPACRQAGAMEVFYFFGLS